MSFQTARRGRVSRWLSLSIALCFLGTSVPGIAVPAASLARIASQSFDIASLNIPESYGSIKERFEGAKDKLIIHIQDIHGDVQAQTHYAKILEYLFGSTLKDQPKVIAAEGAIGNVDLSPFLLAVDKDILTAVADYFLKSALLNGGEYYAVLNDPNTKIHGIDDKDLYFQSLEKFITAHRAFEQVSASWQDLNRILVLLQAKVFNDPLRDMMGVATEFKRGNGKVTDYVKAVDAAARAAGIGTAPYAQVRYLLEAMALESTLDKAKVDPERDRMLRGLQAKMVKEELAALVQRSLLFRTGKISAADFYGYIQETAREKKIPEHAYPNFFRYVQVVLLQGRLETKRLLEETEALEAEAAEKLAATQDEKRLLGVLKDIRILEGLLRLQLNRDQLRYYREHSPEKDVASHMQFIRRLLGEHALVQGDGGWMMRADSPTGAVALARIYPRDLHAVEAAAGTPVSMEEFYRLAEERDEVLVEKTLDAMKTEGARVIVQNTGGFHSDGVLRRLRDRNVSYLVIVPRLTQMPDDAVYLDRMMGGKLPFERFVDGGRQDKLQVLSIWSQLGERPIELAVGDGETIVFDPTKMQDAAVMELGLAVVAAALEKGMDAAAIRAMLSKGQGASQIYVKEATAEEATVSIDGKSYTLSASSTIGRVASAAYRMHLGQDWAVSPFAEHGLAPVIDAARAQAAAADPLPYLRKLIEPSNYSDATFKEFWIELRVKDTADPGFLKKNGEELWRALLDGLEKKEIMTSEERSFVFLLAREVGLQAYPNDSVRKMFPAASEFSFEDVYQQEYMQGKDREDAELAYEKAKKAYEADATVENWAIWVGRELALAKILKDQLSKRDILANIEKNVAEGDIVMIFTRPGLGRRQGEIGGKTMNDLFGYTIGTEVILKTHDVVRGVVKEVCKRHGLPADSVKFIFNDYKNDAFAISRDAKPTDMAQEDFEKMLEEISFEVADRVDREMVPYLQGLYDQLSNEQKGKHDAPSGFGLYPGLSRPVAKLAGAKVQAVAEASSATAIAMLGVGRAPEGMTERRVARFSQEVFDEKLKEVGRAMDQLEGSEFMRFGWEYHSSAVPGMDRAWDPTWVSSAMKDEDLAPRINERIAEMIEADQGRFPDSEELVLAIQTIVEDATRASEIASEIFKNIRNDARSIPMYIRKDIAADVRNWEKYLKQENEEARKQQWGTWVGMVKEIDAAVAESLANDNYTYEMFQETFQEGLAARGPIRDGPEQNEQNKQKAFVRKAYFMRLAHHADQLTGIHDYIKNWGLDEFNEKVLRQTSSSQIAKDTNAIIDELDGLLGGDPLFDAKDLESGEGPDSVFVKAKELLDNDIKNPIFTSHSKFFVEAEKIEDPVLVTFDVKGMGLMNRELAMRNLNNWLRRFKVLDRSGRKTYLGVLVGGNQLTQAEMDRLLELTDPVAQYEAFTSIILPKAGDGVTFLLRQNEQTLVTMLQQRLDVARALGLIDGAEYKLLLEQNRLGYVGGDELTIARSQRFMDLVNHSKVLAALGSDELLRTLLGLEGDAVNAYRKNQGDALLAIQAATSTRAISIGGTAISHEGAGVVPIETLLRSMKDLDIGTGLAKKLEPFGVRGIVSALANEGGTLDWRVKFEYQGTVYEKTVEWMVDNLKQKGSMAAVVATLMAERLPTPAELQPQPLPEPGSVLESMDLDMHSESAAEVKA